MPEYLQDGRSKRSTLIYRGTNEAKPDVRRSIVEERERLTDIALAQIDLSKIDTASAEGSSYPTAQPDVARTASDRKSRGLPYLAERTRRLSPTKKAVAQVTFAFSLPGAPRS